MVRGKRGRKGPLKLKGEVLEFALEKKKENPEIDPAQVAALIKQRYGTEIHRTTVMRGMKKNGARRQKGPPEEFAAGDDPVHAIYEHVRGEALQNLEPPSWALERMCRYGVAGLFPGSQNDLPFILYTQSVPRPAWSGKRDVHRERLHQVYEFLITARADLQDGDGVGTIVDTFDASDCFPACAAHVCVDDCPPGAGERLSFLDTGR